MTATQLTTFVPFYCCNNKITLKVAQWLPKHFAENIVDKMYKEKCGVFCWIWLMHVRGNTWKKKNLVIFILVLLSTESICLWIYFSFYNIFIQLWLNCLNLAKRILPQIRKPVNIFTWQKIFLITKRTGNIQ
jgi:hypothetical protein